MLITTPSQSSLTPDIIYANFEKKVPKHGYNLQVIVELFENHCFRENPYQFTLETLVNNHYNNRSLNKIPVFVLMLGLPDFKEHASEDLLIRIAHKKFESNPQYEKIMQVFYASIRTDDFRMHFEYYINHANTTELNALLRALFEHTSNSQKFSITEEYKQRRDFENSFE